MKQKILLMLVASVFIVGANAQKKTKPVTAYAITAAEKGNSRWTEVRLVDVNTGEVVQSIYNSSDEIETLNARTGKPIVKIETTKNSKDDHEIIMIRSKGEKMPLMNGELKESKKIKKILDTDDMNKMDFEKAFKFDTKTDVRTNVKTKVVLVCKTAKQVKSNAPFATQSAACAYDKKHDRLYYTPMGINQLRYIDLKSKTPKIYYFEDEPLGALSGPGDVPNQITRMVIGGDGNGYALTNNGDHLIRFTTNKKAVITDLGPLTDDAANGKNSVHNGNGYGGDIIADNSGNLYLITAHRAVFKINIQSKVATYKGSIKGLPKGFTTNGAVAEKGTNVIVTSSTSTTGYYKFDLNTLQAEKVSAAETVYNASDLANSNLISDKKIKDKPAEEAEQPLVQQTEDQESIKSSVVDVKEISANKITVYPNPVTNNFVNVSLNDYAPGRYGLQVFDLNGKVILGQEITITGKSHVQELRLPATLAKGNYLIKVANESGRVFNVEKLIVQ